MRASLFLISLALSSAACTQADEYAHEVGVDQNATAEAEAGGSATATSDKGGAVKFEDNATQNGANREFSYSWPAEVSAEPKLAAQLTADRDKELATQKADWAKAQTEFADQDCTACRSLSIQEDWSVVANLPDWLSLSRDSYIYSGGAHGMQNTSGFVWDRKNQIGMDPIAMFNSPVALENALGANLCAALNKERAERRGEDVPADKDQLFSNCPGLDEASVLLGSSNGTTFDRIDIYYGPYVAGPYAEGAYELNFPVTASVLDAVKPEYAAAFSVKR